VDKGRRRDPLLGNRSSFREALTTLELYSVVYNNLTQGDMSSPEAKAVAERLEMLMNLIIQQLEPGQIL